MKPLARCLAPGKHSTNGTFLFLPLPLCFLINRSADTEPGAILGADLHSQQFPSLSEALDNMALFRAQR